MKLKSSHYIFFILFVIFCANFNLNAQNDSIAKVQTVEQPLQFGNDLFIQPSITMELKDINSIYPTEYYKDYYFEYLTYDPVKDPKRLLYNTGLYFGAAVAAFGFLWVMPESFSNWDKDKIREEGIFKQWRENVQAGPVWDEDDWFLNWITHPWAGAVYYMSARGSGYGRWQSFGYSFLMSTFFWEYGVEAFAEIPSWQDLIITPTLGSVLGECFFIWKGKIIRNERKVLNSRVLGGTSLFLMDPFNELLDVFGYKTKNNVQTYSTFAPISYDFSNKKPIWGVSVAMTF